MSSFFASKWCILLTLTCPSPACAGATIRIFSEAADGTSIKPARIKLVQPGARKDYGTAFHEGLAHDIPFGFYDLEVWEPGFAAYKQRLSVFQDRLAVRAVMLASGGEQSGRLQLRGTVLADAESKPQTNIWVVAYPLAGSPENLLQALVDAQGHFLLETAPGGPYLLVVTQGDHVLDCRDVYIGYDNPPVVIKPTVNACHPRP